MSTTYYQLEKAKRARSHEMAVAAILRRAGPDVLGSDTGDVLDGLHMLDEVRREALAHANFDRFLASLGPTGRPAHGHAYIRQLTGERCEYGRVRAGGVGGMDQWSACREPDADHDSLWYRNGKPYVYVSQPYGEENDARLDRWLKWATDHGLTLEFLPHDSWWSPGGMVLLLFKRVALN